MLGTSGGVIQKPPCDESQSRYGSYLQDLARLQDPQRGMYSFTSEGLSSQASSHSVHMTASHQASMARTALATFSMNLPTR